MRWRSALVGILTVIAAAARASSPHSALTPATIDHLIRAEWKQEKIVPAPPVDDARYLRRIYLDIAGTIPPEDVVKAFLADKSPDKRAKAVDALLNSPRYADNWTNYWNTVLMGKQVRSQVVDPMAFRKWLHTQFENNTPWNKFVYDLITARGQNSVGGSYARAYAGVMARDGSDDAVAQDESKVNGAVNWLLKYVQTPADLSGSASKIFLGVQIQCAQCHDHKTEKWKQDDFRKFTACFVEARPRPVDMQRMVKGIRRVDVEDINRPFARRGKKFQGNEYLAADPAALDGTDFSNSANRREALAAWMTAPENPWFAEAIVNRMWAHFLGRGFVEPIDDFRPSNPATMPELLKRLADDFVAHDYDVKHLVRTICATQVYQLSAAPGKNIAPDNKLWARYRLKPMEPEAMLDSLVQATNLGPVLERIAGGNLDAVKFALNRQFTFLFDVDEENEQKDFEGTIPQALMLLNGNLVNRAATPIPGTALAEVMGMPGGDEQKIEELYLRTLSRKPTAAETQRWLTFLNAPRDVILNGSPAPPAGMSPAERRQMRQAMAAKGKRNNGFDPLARAGARLAFGQQTPKGQAYEDLFWTLLNSSEFSFNH